MSRVVKQTLRSSGANVTEKHIEEVSLSALFLLDAAKKADQEFDVKARSISHTVRDSASDINKMVLFIREKGITTEDTTRDLPLFDDPAKKGFELLCKQGWIEGILGGEEEDNDEQSRDTIINEVSLDYEL